MELRPVVSVCRSVATTAARPSLAITSRPSPLPSALVLLQRRSFTPNTNNQRPAEATATATSPSSYTTTISPSNPSRVSPLIPPRPPPAQQSNSNNSNNSNNAPAPTGWANPKSALNKQRLFANTTTTSTGGPTRLTGGKSQLRGGLGPVTGLGSGSSFLDRINKDADLTTPSGPYTMWGNTSLGRMDLAAEPSLRLRPATGRTIDLQGRVDLARGLRVLDRMVAQNGIRKMVRLARQHERPALKRKRLWRERWRSRFKEGFHAAKCRALELKRQGW